MLSFFIEHTFCGHLLLSWLCSGAAGNYAEQDLPLGLSVRNYGLCLLDLGLSEGRNQACYPSSLAEDAIHGCVLSE